MDSRNYTVRLVSLCEIEAFHISQQAVDGEEEYKMCCQGLK